MLLNLLYRELEKSKHGLVVKILISFQFSLALPVLLWMGTGSYIYYQDDKEKHLATQKNRTYQDLVADKSEDSISKINLFNATANALDISINRDDKLIILIQHAYSTQFDH